MLISVFWSGNKTDERVGRMLRLNVAWVEAHTTANEKPNKSEQMRQVVIADGEAGELAKSGTGAHGWDFATHVVKDAHKMRGQIHAAKR